MAFTENTETLTIPRMATQTFRTEGVFQGGTSENAGIKGLKWELRPAEGAERWTLEFSEPNSPKPAKLPPQFQIKVVKAESFQRSDGTVVVTEPPKILFLLRGIQGSRLDRVQLNRAIKKSRFVKEIIPYPAIEDGDMAIEMILSREAFVSPFHPRYSENQIVMDLK